MLHLCCSLFGLILIWHSCGGELVQIDTGPCFSNTALFSCTDYMRNFQTWVILPPADFGTNVRIRSSDTPGSIIERLIGGVPFVFNVTASKSSFKSVTLKIFNSSKINGTVLDCNGNILSLIIRMQNEHSSYIPKLFRIMPYQQNSSLYFWNFTKNYVTINEFLIEIIPLPQHGPDIVTIDNSFFYLFSLESNIQYNITIIRACSDGINNSFMFGSCPLLRRRLSFIVIEYSINMSNIITAHIQCSSSLDFYEIECEENGAWNTDFTKLCSTSQTTTRLHTDTVNLFTAVNETYKITTKVHDNSMMENEGEEDLPEQVSLSVVSFAVILVSMFVISSSTFLVIGIVLGLICGLKCKKHSLNLKENVTKGPVYEEVELETKTTSVTLEQNVAYGHAHN